MTGSILEADLAGDRCLPDAQRSAEPTVDRPDLGSGRDLQMAKGRGFASLVSQMTVQRRTWIIGP